MRFGAAPVVDDVSFEIAAGEKFALVGESGSGKSITALSVLGLVDGAETSGAIRFAGRDLLQAGERELRDVRGGEIAMIFQEPMTALNPLHTVGAQIGEVLALHSGLGRRRSAGAGDRAARQDRHPGAGAAGRRLAAPALGRAAAAGDDRDGARRPAQAPDRRRADHRPRRHHPGADPGPARRPAGGDGPGAALHHPRPQPGAPLHPPGRRDGARPPGRDRADRAGVRGAAARLHPAAAGEPAAPRWCSRSPPTRRG